MHESKESFYKSSLEIQIFLSLFSKKLSMISNDAIDS